MKRSACFLFFALLFIFKTYAQEKLFLKDKKGPILCTIVEINSSEVKYQSTDADPLIISVNKNELEKIVFKSGRTQYFNDYTGQKQLIVKTGLLFPALGFADFYLEKSIRPAKSVEIQMNMIGWGKNINYTNNTNPGKLNINPRGASAGLGLKMLRIPDFESGNRRLRHILQGSYLKPAVSIGYYKRNFVLADPVTDAYTTKTKGIVCGMVSVSAGKQWIVYNTFSLEFYGTIGVGIDNFRTQQNDINKESRGNQNSRDENLSFQNFGYTRFGRGNAGMGVGGGLKVGYLFNCRKPKVNGMDKMRERLNK